MAGEIIKLPNGCPDGRHLHLSINVQTMHIKTHPVFLITEASVEKYLPLNPLQAAVVEKMLENRVTAPWLCGL